jgi:poly(3-hydroxyalkanoate) synthetase
MWPMLAAMSAREATTAFVNEFARLTGGATALRPRGAEPEWATPNRVVFELPSLRLRDFSAGEAGRPTLICGPYALHGCTVADFAPGHSLVETLRAQGRRNLHLVEWRSATPAMRFYSIDSLLADLNVAVDAFGEPVDLIGVCQGGWMALLYAARFPEKVRRLVAAGAPLDLSAGESNISRLAARTPLAAFSDLLRVGDGCLLGQMMLRLWGAAPENPADIRRELQIEGECVADEAALLQRFRDWFDWTVDLPGIYYLEVVEWLYKENRLANGSFVALGRQVDPAALRLPVLLLAGRDDVVVVPAQAVGIASRLGSPPEDVATIVAPSTHLGLFMGAQTLADVWPGIVAWLDRETAPADRPA